MYPLTTTCSITDYSQEFEQHIDHDEGAIKATNLNPERTQ